MGRPSKLQSEEFRKQFIECVEEGLPIKYCCDYCKVSEQSFYTWKKIAENDSTEENLEYRFLELVKKAHVAYVREAHKRIKKGEPGWQGQAWWLERTDPMFMLKTDKPTSEDKVTIVADVPKKFKELK